MDILQATLSHLARARCNQWRGNKDLTLQILFSIWVEANGLFLERITHDDLSNGTPQQKQKAMEVAQPHP